MNKFMELQAGHFQGLVQLFCRFRGLEQHAKVGGAIYHVVNDPLGRAVIERVVILFPTSGQNHLSKRLNIE